MFKILFEDEHLIAIDKPPGILVHRTGISADRVFVLQQLRNQIGQHIFPVHRLDRATSGVLLFGKNAQIAGALGEQMMQQKFEKQYLAVLRGYLLGTGWIDNPIADPESDRKGESAQTFYQCLGTSERPWSIGLRYATARFSLVRAEPLTGRRHQIRRHFSHLRHPIIGDTRHGDVKHNKYFRENFNLQRILLHAAVLRFQHPVQTTHLRLIAPLDPFFLSMLELLELKNFCPPEFLPPSNPCTA